MNCVLEPVAVNPALDLELPTSGSRERAAEPQADVALLEPLATLERTLLATRSSPASDVASCGRFAFVTSTSTRL